MDILETLFKEIQKSTENLTEVSEDLLELSEGFKMIGNETVSSNLKHLSEKVSKAAEHSENCLCDYSHGLERKEKQGREVIVK